MKIWITLCCLYAGSVFAGIRWNENKGQVKNLQGELRPEVLYYGNTGGVDVFLTGRSIQYQYRQELDNLEPKTLFKRVVMNLVGANIPSEVVAVGSSEDCLYFFSEAESRNAKKVQSFSKLIFKNVYQGIDWVVYSDDRGLKHDFIVHAGANPALIKMGYSGAEGVNLTKDGTIHVSTSLGYFTENEVICLQDGRQMSGAYKQLGDEFGFELPEYDSGRDLIIDPGVEWSTYYGGADEDRGLAILPVGEYYYAGGSSKSSTMISTSGTYQEVYSGGLLDGWIAKFHKDGTRIWSTYFGGNANDVIQAMALTSTGKLIVTGVTRSNNMATPGAHQVARGSAGSSDGLLASFDTTGSVLNWSTYYGGNQDDWAFDVAIDQSDNIYFCMETRSTNATSISTTGSHQPAIGLSGFTDAALVKFNAAGQRIWGTYYGGTGSDNAYRLQLINGKIAVTGKSNSPNAIALNGFQSAPAGGDDAFLSFFSTNGVLLYGTYFGGSAAEASRGLGLLPDGRLVFGGSTASSNLPVNAHQFAYGGGLQDGFICVVDSLGAYVSSAYYGGGSSDVISSICTDSAGAIYAVGSSSSVNNIFEDGFQQQPISNALAQFNTEGFVVKFDSEVSRIWGTYWGAWNDTSSYSADQLNDVALDDDHVLTLIGSTEGYLGYAVNAHQSVHGGNFDAFITKMNTSVISSESLVDSVYCWGDSIFVNYSSDAAFLPGNILTLEFVADSGSIYSVPVEIISQATTASQGTLAAVIPQNLLPGDLYHIRISSTAPVLTGQIGDQLITITRCLSIAGTDLSGAPFCVGSKLDIAVDLIGPDLSPANVYSALISGPAGSFANAQFIGLVNEPGDATIEATLPLDLVPGNNYRIKVISSSLSALTDLSAPFQVHQPDLNLSFTIADNQIGIPYIAQFTNNAIDPALDYFWFFGDGTGIQSNTQVVGHQYAFAGAYPVALFAMDSITGCRDTLFDPLDSSKTVYCTTNQPGCNLQAIVSPSSIVNGCIGGSVTLTSNTGTGYSYQWNLNGLPIGGETQPSLTTSIPGFYSITIYLDSCSVLSDAVQVSFNQPAVPVPQISQSDTLGYCGSNSVTLSASTGYSSYLWNTGETSQSILVNASGLYYVTGFTAALGCAQQSDTLFLSGSLVPPPSLCMVTVDTTINKNLLMWEKPITTAIDSFIIYRESAQAGVYNIIGAVDYDDLSEFTDSTSLPNVRSYRYKIGIRDTCGGMSLPSAFHKTIHLQVSPGLGVARNLSWTHYEGLSFPSYEVYVGLPGGQLTLLQTLPSTNNTFTDLNPLFGIQSRYYLEIVLPSACESTRALRTRSTSNTSGNPSIFLPPVWAGPELFCPDSGQSGLPLSFTMQWDTILDANGYEVEVDDSPLFGSPALFSSSGTETTVSGLLPSGTYFWRVRGQNFAANTEWSGVNQFTTGTQAALGAPGNLFPASGANFPVMPNLQWSPVSGADGYLLYFADSSASQFIALAAGDTSYSPANGNGIYFWSVASTLCGDTSAFSDTLSFSIGTVGFNEAFRASVGVIPNPNRGDFVIQLNGNWNPDLLSLSITDVSGRVLVVPSVRTDGRYRIDYSFAAGMYFVRVTDGTAEVIQKVVVE